MQVVMVGIIIFFLKTFLLLALRICKNSLNICKNSLKLSPIVLCNTAGKPAVCLKLLLTVAYVILIGWLIMLHRVATCQGNFTFLHSEGKVREF